MQFFRGSGLDTLLEHGAYLGDSVFDAHDQHTGDGHPFDASGEGLDGVGV
ncbi:MAG: hypothetical protein GWP91_18590 [Rhodobacterales bacterium]|nr:hypothetical protein [Rhodobacterales bacterium]